MSQMLKSSGAMGIATMVSRLLGLVREILYARFMGVSLVAGAFHMAYLIPGLFRRLLGEGALTAAFIPIFKEKEKLEGERAMWEAANAVISGLVIVACIVTAIVMIVATALLSTVSWDRETELMLRLLRVMFPYMVLVCVAAILMGMLNARGYFFIPALGAAMLNVVMIAAVLFLAPRMGEHLQEQVFGLAIGILIAGVAQAGFQIPSLYREGFHFRWVRPWPNEAVRSVVERMAAGILGVAALQINVLATQSIAFAVDARIVAAFNYAVRFMELPQGVFGISLATYLLPTLSGFAAEKKYSEFKATLQEGLGYIILLNFLASALLIVLAEPIIRLVFEYGEFDRQDTGQVAFALACLAPGLVAFSVVNILARAFYALGDTGTPMRIAVVCLALNVIFTAWLIFPFGVGGLGIANTMSALFNSWLLMYALRRKLKTIDFSPLQRDFAKAAAGALLAAAIAFSTRAYWEQNWGTEGLVNKAATVFLPMSLAGLGYWALLLWLRVSAARQLLDFFRGESKAAG